MWIGQTVSEIGSILTAVAASLYVFLETGSALWLGVLAAATAAPSIAVAAFSPWIDRFGPRRSMLVADATAAISPVVLLSLALGGRLEPWHLLVGGAITGLGTAVQHAAGQAALPLLLDEEDLARANALEQIGPAVGIVVGPALATPILVHVGIEAILLIDLASFVIGFGAVLVTRLDAAPSPADDDGSWQSAWTWLVDRDPALLRLMAASGVVNVVLAVFNVALVAMAVGVVGEARLGFVLAAGGVAMLIGAVSAGRVRPGHDRIRLFSLTLVVVGGGSAVAAFRPNGWLLVVGVVIVLSVVPITNAALATLYSERVPPAMQGRVFALRGSVSQVLQPAGSLLGGLVVARVAEPALGRDGRLAEVLSSLVGGTAGRGAALTLMGCGVALGVLAVAMLRSRLRADLATPASAAGATRERATVDA